MASIYPAALATIKGMEQEQFSAGDVVQLKSGGPEMTIEGIGKYGMGATHDKAKCVWFDGPNRKEGLFELHMLTKA